MNVLQIFCVLIQLIPFAVLGDEDPHVVDGSDSKHYAAFSDHFIHPSRLKHHEAATADDHSLHATIHRYEVPMRSGGWGVFPARSASVEAAEGSLPTSPPMTPLATSSLQAVQQINNGSSSSSWLVEDVWEDDDDSENEDDDDDDLAHGEPPKRQLQQQQPMAPPSADFVKVVPAAPAAPQLSPEAPAQVHVPPSVQPAPTYTAPINMGKNPVVPQQVQFVYDIPLGSATESPIPGKPATAGINPSELEPVEMDFSEPEPQMPTEDLHGGMAPLSFVKSSINLYGRNSQPQLQPQPQPQHHSFGGHYMPHRPQTNLDSGHYGLISDGATGAGSDHLEFVAAPPLSVEGGHGKLDHGYFHSRTDYLEMPAGATLDGATDESDAHVAASAAATLVETTGDTFLLKIPDDAPAQAGLTADSELKQPMPMPMPMPMSQPLISSGWMLKTPCSRTCGIGIEVYEMIHKLPNNITKVQLQYKLCGMLLCPGETVTATEVPNADPTSASYSPLAYSSRVRQCSRFNTQPFDGLHYAWTPYYTTTGQCELFCLARSANFYHKFAEAVEDGTPCDAYSTSAVCIGGQCRNLGCDGLVDSTAKLDRCGVCGGHNDTCDAFEGLVMSGEFTLGYNDLVTIPAGATSIFVNEMSPSINNLALRMNTSTVAAEKTLGKIPKGHDASEDAPQQRHWSSFVLNGDYHVGLSKKLFVAGTLFQYIHNDKHEESISAEGPITEPITIVMLYQGDHVNIHYSYSVQKANSSLMMKPAMMAAPMSMPMPMPMSPMGLPAVPNVVPNPTVVTSTSFTWLAGEWSACSVTCGAGNRLRVIICVDSASGNVVADHLCPSDTRLTNVEACNMETCTTRWKADEWSACSVTCGNVPGVQLRKVSCIDMTWAEQPTVANELCLRLGQPKPVSEQPCMPNVTHCPKWLTGAWGPCNATCGHGNQTREVTCTVPEGADKVLGCPEAFKPAATQACQSPRPCSHLIDWTVSTWTACSEPCGGGVSTRIVRCATASGQVMPDAFCRFKQRPSHLRRCPPDEKACKPRWTTSEWTNCSVECGLGVRTRHVICVHVQTEATNVLDDGYCRGLARPDSEEVCKGISCTANHSAAWFIGPWSRCSATCGSGHRTRIVLCLTNGTNSTCPLASRPHSRQRCEAKLATCDTPQPACVSSEFGCCPDGTTLALGQLLEGCPPPPPAISTNILRTGNLVRNYGDCSTADYGCCPDGLTPALGPFNAGCPQSSCSDSRYGCCPDSLLQALGPNNEGCTPVSASSMPMSNCAESMFGCCPDGMTPARGLAFRGCEGLCQSHRFGCCPDNVHAASGVNFEGCPASSLRCTDTEFGCCPDGKTPALSPGGAGCPGMKIPLDSQSDPSKVQSAVQYVKHRQVGTIPQKPHRLQQFTVSSGLPSTTVSTTTVQNVKSQNEAVDDYDNEEDCDSTEFGCCQDGITPSQGPNFQGCEDYADDTCATTEFGCCEDGVMPAMGPNGEGCEPTVKPMSSEVTGEMDTTTWQPSSEVDEHESTEEEEMTTTPHYVETINLDLEESTESDHDEPHVGSAMNCSMTEFGCCTDGQTPAAGPDFAGCAVDCMAEHLSGDCEDHKLVWYYDGNHGVCARFWYCGCGGNSNRFPTEPACKARCVLPPVHLDRCYLPSIKGPCNRPSSRDWHYFDRATGTCRRFSYGGCNGNANRFESRELCEMDCLEPLRTATCGEYVDSGPCDGNKRQWTYDSSEGKCHPFRYGGCLGNRNRFDSEESCMGLCSGFIGTTTTSKPTPVPEGVPGLLRQGSLDKCRLPKSTGPCRAHMKRWFYDGDTGSCRQFVYGGCHGNENRFLTASDCMSTCGGKSDGESSTGAPTSTVKANHPACLFNADHGPCKEDMPRFYYDPTAGRCLKFTFGGCGGNQNNFADESHCESVCKPEITSELYRTGQSATSPKSSTSAEMHHHKMDKIREEEEEHEVTKSAPRKDAGYDDPLDCLEDFSYGDCSDNIEVWTFDSSLVNCVVRMYSGCGGTANRFPSFEHCMRTCIQPATPPQTQTTHEIEDEVTSSGYGPSSYSTSSAETSSSAEWTTIVDTHSITSSSELDPSANMCDLRVDVGSSCHRTSFGGNESASPSLRFYYDRKSDNCRPFSFGGCHGNDNNFGDEMECLRACARSSPAVEERQLRSFDDCFQATAQKGNCEGQHLRWYFDFEFDRRCKAFFYTGCGGSPNNFMAHADCSAYCSRASCPSMSSCSILAEDCPYGMDKDTYGCTNCRCFEPCRRCRADESCRIIDNREAGGIVEAECTSADGSSSSTCSSEFGCCADGTTPAMTPDRSDCPPSTPEIDASSPEYVEAIAGDTVVLPCRAKGAPTPTIVWFKNWRHVFYNAALAARLKQTSSGSLEIPETTPNDTANYTCRADNGVGGDRPPMRNYQLVVRKPPSFIGGPTSRQLQMTVKAKLGSRVILPCSAEGDPTPEIRWEFGSRQVLSELPDVQQVPEGLQIEPVEVKHLGIYTCTAENRFGSRTRHIKVDAQAALAVHILPHNESIYAGAQLALECEASGSQRPRIRWHKHNGHLDHATIVEDLSSHGIATAKLLIDNVQPSDSGKYTCTTWKTANGREEREHAETNIRVLPAVASPAVSILRKPESLHHRASSAETISVIKQSMKPETTSSAEIIEEDVEDFSDLDEATASTPKSVATSAASSEAPWPGCVDRPQFANCGLIVAARLCGHQSFSKFCCESCYKAGQITKPASKKIY